MAMRSLCRLLGNYFLGFSLTLFIPLIAAVYYEYFSAYHPQPHSTIAFVETITFCALLGAFLKCVARGAEHRFFRREGLAMVVFIWILSPAIGALPFLLSGTLTNPVQAYFEATSGMTTTGASLLVPKKYDNFGQELPYHRIARGEIDTNYNFFGTVVPVRDASGKVVKEGVEAVSKAVLLWRSLMQWMGGLGIVVLFVAILPALGVGGKMLFHAEMPGPMKETLTPRIKETALVLWKFYFGLSILQVVLLMTTNRDLTFFDSLCLTFSTISTGGFTVINGSIGAYKNAATEWVVMLFIMVGSINFSLYYFAMRGKLFRFKDVELGVYLALIIFGGCFIATELLGTPNYLTNGAVGPIYHLREAARSGFFQFISAITSTGFAIGNYDQWPYSSQVLMLIAIYLGGMSGSTAGGMKIIRHIMVFRIVQDKVELLFRPETVRQFRIGSKSVDKGAALTVLCFFVTVMVISAIGTFLLTLDGLDPETALAIITSTINNSGMGFREAGPTDSFVFLSTFGMILSSFWMILGRLEFFAVLVLFIPAFWKED